MGVCETSDCAGFLITWTTYGTWLPGDARGWRSRRGFRTPQPLLEDWCRKRMRGEVVLLEPVDRDTVEQACGEHCNVRGWVLLAVSARTNHVHAVVVAGAPPQKVRDQLKANCTRRLRLQPIPLAVEKTWTSGGDCVILPDAEALEAAIRYVNDLQ